MKISDVARVAGVSPGTVSRALNNPDRVKPTTRTRILEVVERLGYIPDAAARTLANGRTRSIGLVLSDIRDPYFTTLARGVEDQAQEHGYTLILGNTDEQAPKEHEYLNVMVSRRVDGVLLSTSGDDVRLLQRREIPFVLFDRRVPSVAADLVTSDSYDGGRQLVRHLVERNYREIGFVGGPPRISTLEERLSGYRDAVREAGLTPHIRLGRYDRASGEEIIESLLAEGNLPSALIAANSAVAIGVIAALRRNGVQVPDEVGLAGFGDFEAEAILPFLTVIAQPAYEIGREAMKLLLARLEGDTAPPRERVFPVSLVVRESTPGPRA